MNDSTKKGFTLIELLVVASIISFLASIIMAGLSEAREKARIAAGKQFEASVKHVLGNDIIAEWTFDNDVSGMVDEYPGTYVVDSNGNIPNKPIRRNPFSSCDPYHYGYIQGVVGQALDIPILPITGFSGCTNYIELSTLDSGNPFFPIYPALKSYTISFWVKSNSPLDNVVYAEKKSGDPPDFELSSASPLGKPEKFRIRIMPYFGNFLDAVSTRSVFDGHWHHVLWTDNNGVAALYVDGQIDETNFNYTRGDLTGHIFNNSSIAGSGSDNWFTNAVFNGSIDQFRIYGKALSE